MCSATSIWPAEPSLEGYWVVFTQGYWYLENFWHQFGNSVYVGAATTFLTLAIASWPASRSRGCASGTAGWCRTRRC